MLSRAIKNYCTLSTIYAREAYSLNAKYSPGTGLGMCSHCTFSKLPLLSKRYDRFLSLTLWHYSTLEVRMANLRHRPIGIVPCT